MDYSQHLIIDPNVRLGKVTIKGTRITVSDVLGWMASAMEIEDVIADFPELKEAQIRACLAYAADREHKFEIRKLPVTIPPNANDLRI